MSFGIPSTGTSGGGCITRNNLIRLTGVNPDGRQTKGEIAHHERHQEILTIQFVLEKSSAVSRTPLATREHRMIGGGNFT